MQEKLQKISPIKQRILQHIDSLQLSKREFYHTTGISRGTLEAKTGITEDTLTKIFAKYPDLDVRWVVLGEKSRHPPDHAYKVEEPPGLYATPGRCASCDLRQQVIDAQRKTIETLEGKIADLEGQKRKAC